MLLASIALIAGLALLYFGAEILVAGALGLSMRLGVSSLVAGLTVVAMGTSMPEFFVSFKAAWDQETGLALGNIVGSNIFNITVVLGLAAVICPIRVERQLLRLEVPFLIALTAAFAMAISLGGVSQLVGVLFIITFGIYVTWTVLSLTKEKSASKSTEEEKKGSEQLSGMSYFKAIALMLLGVTMLGFGADWFVYSGVFFARYFEVSETIIGLTILAMGTSTPELASTLVAAKRKETDVVIGNVLGSNLFNILFVAGGAGLVFPLPRGDISSVDIGFLLVSAILLFPIAKTGHQICRREGLILVFIQAVFLFLIWPK
ncbi:MAG: calcium/sodium antiporter [Chthoniobacterales bacterium]